jgi:hypothetical protein
MSPRKLAGKSKKGYFGAWTVNLFNATLLSSRELISNLVPLKNNGDPFLALSIVSNVAQLFRPTKTKMDKVNLFDILYYLS